MATDTRTDRSVFRAELAEKAEDHVILAIPGTNYRLKLAVNAPPDAPEGEWVAGRIHARATRLDPIVGGGRWIEPVFGRPRRMQGRVVGPTDNPNELVIRCVVPFVCLLTRGQDASRFPPGQLVRFSVERGARLEQVQDEDAPLPPSAKLTTPGFAHPPENPPDEDAVTHTEVPGGKIRDAGSLTDTHTRGMTGQEERPGSTNID